MIYDKSVISYLNSVTFTEYSELPFSEAAIERVQADLSKFRTLVEGAGLDLSDYPCWEHDLWLTRNRHGAGF